MATTKDRAGGLLRHGCRKRLVVHPNVEHVSMSADRKKEVRGEKLSMFQRERLYIARTPLHQCA
jgi:hypothetical protein